MKNIYTNKIKTIKWYFLVGAIVFLLIVDIFDYIFYEKTLFDLTIRGLVDIVGLTILVQVTYWLVVNLHIRMAEGLERPHLPVIHDFHLAQVIEQAQEAVVITDLNGAITYTNPHFETITGYSKAEIIGNNLNILKSGVQSQTFYEKLWRDITIGHNWNGVFINKRKNGTLYHEEASIFPIIDTAGNTIYYAAVKRDVTAQVQAKAALKQQLEFQQKLLNAIPLPVFYKDQTGHYLDCNNAFETYSGKPRDEIVGKTVFDLTPPEQAKLHAQHDQELFQNDGINGGILIIEGVKLLPQSDSKRDVVFHKTVLENADGEQPVLLGVIIDITEQRQVEAALKKSTAELEQSNRALAGRISIVESLHQVGVAMSSQLDPETLLQFIVEQTVLLVNAASCSVLLPDETTGDLVFRASVDNIVGLSVPAGRGIAGWVLHHGEPKIINDVSTVPDYYGDIISDSDNIINTQSLLAVPLVINNNTIGVLEAINKHNGAFTKVDREVMMILANDAAVALENARLHAQTRQEIAQRKQTEAQLAHLNATLENQIHQQASDMEALHDLARKIVNIQNIDDFLELLLQNLGQIVPHNISAGVLATGRAEEYKFFIQPGRPTVPAVIDEVSDRLQSTFSLMSTEENGAGYYRHEPLIIEPAGYRKDDPPLTQLQSTFQVPLIIGPNNRITGLLFVGAEQENAFSEQHVRLMYTLSYQASLFLSVRRSEAAQRASEETARALLNAPTDSSLLISLNGTILALNSTAVYHMKRPEVALVGANYYSVCAPPLAELLPDYVNQVVKTGEPARFESDGDEHTFDHNIYPVKNEQGRVFQVAIFNRDITEQKLAEQALQYRMAFEELVTNISTTFARLSTDDLDSGIDFALESTGLFTLTDRSYVFIFTDEAKQIITNTHEWCAEGITSQLQNRQQIPTNALGWWMEQLKRLQVAYIPLMADYEPNTAKENEFLQAGIVQSMIVVPMVHHTSLVGFIGFDAVTQPKTWADDIISLLTILGEIIVSAMERRQSQQKIEAALKEKELLLKEIHHRVKNNLQVISSLLNLQSRHITDPQTLEIYRESRNRVKSMALIHEKLYRSADLVQIDFKEYIKALINDLFRSYKIRGAAIQLHVEINDIFLNVGQATPCGLIINELVSNALKHAFPNEQAGSILIEFFAEGENMVINVTDNGVGMSPAIDLTRTESLGLRLVMTLVRQIGGAINLHRQNGTKFSITFPQKNS